MYIHTIDYLQTNASQALADSIKETGFAILKNHPVKFQLVKEIYIEWEDFFHSKTKFDYLYDKEKMDGYYPFLTEHAKGHPQKDLKEYYHVFAWGRYPKSLSQRTRDFFFQMSELGATVLQWLEQHTPLAVRKKFPMPLAEMIRESNRTALRILHYPPLPRSDKDIQSVRAAPHEDINLLSLFPAATSAGLEVKDKTGKWHTIKCDPSAIVVNTGDMLQMCSQKYYPSSTHQVVNPVGEDRQISRFAMLLFLHPRDEVQLSPQQTAKTYLMERLKEIGVIS